MVILLRIIYLIKSRLMMKLPKYTFIETGRNKQLFTKNYCTCIEFPENHRISSRHYNIQGYGDRKYRQDRVTPDHVLGSTTDDHFIWGWGPDSM